MTATRPSAAAAAAAGVRYASPGDKIYDEKKFSEAFHRRSGPAANPWCDNGRCYWCLSSFLFFPLFFYLFTFIFFYACCVSIISACVYIMCRI